MERTNEDWTASLSSSDLLRRDTALLELQKFLLRGLNGAFRDNDSATPTIIEDSAQEALLRITANLDSFRGESMFLTWAMKIAIRLAYSEMRKIGWKDVSLDQISETEKPLIEKLADNSYSPEKLLSQAEIIEKMWQAINESLTEKQKKALIADFVGDMPIEEIGREMGTNRNAVYKLLYDARQNLQKYLVASEITFSDVKAAFDM